SKSFPQLSLAALISRHRRSMYCSKLSSGSAFFRTVGMEDSQYILPSRSTNPNLVFVPPMSMPRATFFIRDLLSQVMVCKVRHFAKTVKKFTGKNARDSRPQYVPCINLPI